ncbi:uncharacterized protein LOC110830366 [Zootermopsis nevadensis]|uniref:uncharacterized protein LOC110830366 n=1 Tax=Zootermopsis nevadensis TaxID=136037 RepID=UPI000B8E6D64|nr:uncharacterized protein LOC110830366 [Zootermopsis nevadensis]
MEVGIKSAIVVETVECSVDVLKVISVESDSDYFEGFVENEVSKIGSYKRSSPEIFHVVSSNEVTQGVGEVFVIEPLSVEKSEDGKHPREHSELSDMEEMRIISGVTGEQDLGHRIGSRDVIVGVKYGGDRELSAIVSAVKELTDKADSDEVNVKSADTLMVTKEEILDVEETDPRLESAGERFVNQLLEEGLGSQEGEHEFLPEEFWKTGKIKPPTERPGRDLREAEDGYDKIPVDGTPDFILPEVEASAGAFDTEYESAQSSTLYSTDEQISGFVSDSRSIDRFSPFLSQESHRERVPHMFEAEKEVISDPALDNIFVKEDTGLVDVCSGETFGGFDIDEDHGEDTGIEKPEASISDHMQDNLLPKTVSVLPSLSSPSNFARKFISDAREEMGHVTQKSRKQRLLFETHVTETEVKELMSEVREVTRQIKQEVRELKPDLTPTPEGKESSILPPSESREFVELTDLGCIKEEQIVDFHEERPQRLFMSYERDDTVIGAVSVEEKLPVPGEEEADILKIVSDLETIQRVSPGTEVLQKLGAEKLDLTGENVSTSPVVRGSISQPLTQWMQGGDGIFEEQISDVSSTFMELNQMTSGETYFEKENMLHKSSTSLMEMQEETQTRSTVRLDSATCAISEGAVEVSDKDNDCLFETETEKHHASLNESERTHVSEFSMKQIPAKSGAESVDLSPSEHEGALPSKSLKKLQMRMSLDIDILDKHSFTEDKFEKLPVLEGDTERLEGEFVQGVPNVFDTLETTNIALSVMDISDGNLYHDGYVGEEIIQNKDSEVECSDFVTLEEETSLSYGTVAYGEEDIESHSPGPDGSVIHETNLGTEETGSSVVVETCAEVEFSTEIHLQEIEPLLPVDTNIVEGTQPSSTGKDVTPILQEEHVDKLMSVVEKSSSTPVILSPGLVYQSESGTLSQQELSWETSRKKESEGLIATSDSLFGMSADDIVMKDDLLEVTVTAGRTDSVRTEGKLFRTESGSTYLEFETGGTHSLCVCEDIVTSQPITLHGPDPSIIHHAEKVRQDAFHDESGKTKDSVKSTPKKKRSEKQVQTAKRATREPGTKILDDRKTITLRSKEPDKPAQVTAASSSGTASRYRGYMASTLSRDLKVERSVTERSLNFNRDISTKKRVTADREDSPSTSSPSKPPVPKEISAGAVPKSPQMISKSRRVESRSTSAEKEVRETVTRKQVSVSKHVKTTREDKLGNIRLTSRSLSDTTVRQRDTSSGDSTSSSVRQSRLHSTVRKTTAETEASQEHGRKSKREEHTKLMRTKTSDVRKDRKKAVTDLPTGECPSGAIADSKSKAKFKETLSELESSSEIDSGVVFQATLHSTEVTKIDDTMEVPVPSCAEIPTAVEHGITTSHITDFKDMHIAHTISLTVQPKPHGPTDDDDIPAWCHTASYFRGFHAYR